MRDGDASMVTPEASRKIAAAPLMPNESSPQLGCAVEGAIFTPVRALPDPVRGSEQLLDKSRESLSQPMSLASAIGRIFPPTSPAAHRPFASETPCRPASSDHPATSTQPPSKPSPHLKHKRSETPNIEANPTLTQERKKQKTLTATIKLTPANVPATEAASSFSSTATGPRTASGLDTIARGAEPLPDVVVLSDDNAGDDDDGNKHHSNGLIVPDEATKQRLQDHKSRLTDVDIEWALNMLLCCCPNARYGDSRIANRACKAPRFTHPSFWPDSIKDTSGTNEFCVALPVHTTNHWFAVLASVVVRLTRDNSLSLIGFDNCNNIPTTSITSIKVFNSVAVTTLNDHLVVDKVRNVLRTYITGSITCKQTEVGNSSNDHNDVTIDHATCSQQDVESVGCGIYTIVYTWRFLQSTAVPRETSHVMSVNEVMWRKLLEILCSLCICFKPDHPCAEKHHGDRTGPTPSPVQSSAAILEEWTLVPDAQKQCDLASPELIRAQADVARLDQLLNQPSLHLADAVRYTDRMRAATQAVTAALLRSASGSLSSIQAAIRDLKEICELLTWTAKSARAEYLRLETEVIPALRLRSRDRHNIRQPISTLPPTPYTTAVIALLEQEGRFERRQIRFYCNRAAEARRTEAITCAATTVAQRDLDMILEVHVQLQTFIASLEVAPT